jgi:hypothetical protein
LRRLIMKRHEMCRMVLSRDEQSMMIVHLIVIGMHHEIIDHKILSPSLANITNSDSQSTLNHH